MATKPVLIDDMILVQSQIIVTNRLRVDFKGIAYASDFHASPLGFSATISHMIY